MSALRRVHLRDLTPGQRLIWAASAAGLLLFSVGVIFEVAERGRDRSRIADETRREAATSALHAGYFIEKRLDVLEAIATSPVVHGDDAREIQAQLDTVGPSSLGFSGGMAWADRTGVMRATTGLVVTSPSEREFVRSVLAAGEPAVGPLSSPGAQAGLLLLLAVPSHGADGPNGVLLGALRLDTPAGAAPDMTFAEGVPLQVVDRYGQLIVGHTPVTQPVDVSASALLAEARAEGRGVRAETTGLLGEPGRLVGFAPAPLPDWTVLVDRSADEAFAAVERTFRSEILIFAVLVVLGVAVAVWVGRALDRIAASERRIAATERRAAAAEHAALRAAEATIRQREELLATVSHDLRSPLTTIRGFSSLLRRRAEREQLAAGDAIRDAANEIETAATRMNGMLGELLDAARLQAGREVVLDCQTIDIVPIVRDTVHDEQMLASRHAIRFETSVESAYSECDSMRLQRVFGNLLSNAVKFSPDGGEVIVRLTSGGESERMITIAVSDVGLGIPAADLPHVFERYYRASNAAGIVGTGLGLAGSRQLVELHGGTLVVESTEGKGSTFSVRLPLAAPPAPPGS